jgi:hypothetical protein
LGKSIHAEAPGDDGVIKKKLGMCAVIIALFLSGCAQRQNEQGSAPNAPKIHIQAQLRNGAVLSMKKMVAGMNHSDLYELDYRSEGEKVQAYVELPSKPGTYPLMVLKGQMTIV